jgi:DNA-binding PadR family transcriptional regulator
MTAIEHAILATIVLYFFHKWGEWKGRRELVEDVIENTLDSLEQQGYIVTEVNADGEKELLKVQKRY